MRTDRFIVSVSLNNPREGVVMKTKSSRYILLVLILVLSLMLAGCVSSNEYQTKPDYAITEQVTQSFLDYYSRGEIEKALGHVAEDAILSTDSGEMEGKSTIKEMIKLNREKDNTIEVLENSKIDDSRISYIIANRIPLFQIAGVEVVKTKEKFEVQDGKIVKWEIKHLKESVDLIEKVAVGTTGLELQVTDDKIVVKDIRKKTPADNSDIKKGDIILSIDGIALKDMKYGAEEIPYRMIGEVGSRVKLEVSRGTETFEVNLRRINMNDL